MNDTVPTETDPGPIAVAADRKVAALNAEAAKWRKALRVEEERSRGLQAELAQARSDLARATEALRTYVTGGSR